MNGGKRFAFNNVREINPMKCSPVRSSINWFNSSNTLQVWEKWKQRHRNAISGEEAGCLWHLSSSWQVWRWLYSEMLHCVVWYKSFYVSEVPAASVISVVLLRYTAQDPRRQPSSGRVVFMRPLKVNTTKQFYTATERHETSQFWWTFHFWRYVSENNKYFNYNNKYTLLMRKWSVN
jgi:hypothetical protein